MIAAMFGCCFGVHYLSPSKTNSELQSSDGKVLSRLAGINFYGFLVFIYACQNEQKNYSLFILVCVFVEST
jgi:hypothetical protein